MDQRPCAGSVRTGRRGKSHSAPPTGRSLGVDSTEDYAPGATCSLHDGRGPVRILADNGPPTGELRAILPIMIEGCGTRHGNRHRRLVNAAVFRPSELVWSPWTPQPVKRHEIRTRAAARRSRDILILTGFPAWFPAGAIQASCPAQCPRRGADRLHAPAQNQQRSETSPELRLLFRVWLEPKLKRHLAQPERSSYSSVLIVAPGQERRRAT